MIFPRDFDDSSSGTNLKSLSSNGRAFFVQGKDGQIRLKTRQQISYTSNLSGNGP